MYIYIIISYCIIIHNRIPVILCHVLSISFNTGGNSWKQTAIAINHYEPMVGIHIGWGLQDLTYGRGGAPGFGMAMSWALEVGMWWYDVRIKLGGWSLFFCLLASLLPFFHSWFSVSFCVFEGQTGVFVYFSQISGVHRHPFSQRSWGGGHAEAIMGSTGDIPWVLSCWKGLKMVDFSTPREENMRQHCEVHESFLWIARFIFTVWHLRLCVHCVHCVHPEFSGFFGVRLTTDHRGALHLGSLGSVSAQLQDLETPHHPWTWDEWIEHQKTSHVKHFCLRLEYDDDFFHLNAAQCHVI